MKTILTFIFLALSCSSNAAVLTVSNMAANPGQYNTVPAAISAALPGDTIYVHGSPNHYGNITIDKTLYLLGTGHHPRKQVPFKSILQSITFTNDASGTTIDGFDLINGGGIAANFLAIDDIIIRHCQISGGIELGYTGGAMNNWLIENNILSGSSALNTNSSPDLTNFIFRNNIVYNQIFNVVSNIIIDHNFFFSTNIVAFNNVNNAVITNNIFYIMSPQGANTSTFNNNLTYNTPSNTLPYGTNTGSNNLENVDPLLVSYPVVGAIFSTTHDYHLQAGSPGAGAATDGSDLGVEDGLSGFKMSGEPPVPVIRAFNILNTTVPVGGQLNISVTATKAEDQ